eukprot:gene16011-19055_t
MTPQKYQFQGENIFGEAEVQQLRKQISSHYQLLVQVMLRIRVEEQIFTNAAIKTQRKLAKRHGEVLDLDKLVTPEYPLAAHIPSLRRMLDEVYANYRKHIEKNVLSHILTQQIESPSKVITRSSKRPLVPRSSPLYDDECLKLHTYLDDLLQADPRPTPDSMAVILNVFDCFDEGLKYKETNLLRLKFTPTEDTLLKLGLERYGQNWANIQLHLLPTKSIDQIFHRYKNRTASKTNHNVLKDYLKSSKLTKEEDTLLQKGVAKQSDNMEVVDGVLIKWSRDEDKALLLSIREKGLSDGTVWQWISENKITNKTAPQINQRYLHLIDLMKKTSTGAALNKQSTT